MLMPLESSTVYVKPSEKFIDFIKSLKDCEKLTANLLRIKTGSKPENEIEPGNYTQIDNLFGRNQCDGQAPDKHATNASQLINTVDLKLIAKIIENDPNPSFYLHQLMENSEILLPKNPIRNRNKNLELNCMKIRNRLANLEYNKMTRNVDCCRGREPQDTFAYHCREIDRQLLLVFQIIFSVAATFAFGMFGLPFIFSGNAWLSKIPSRIIVSLILSFIVIVAELYFTLKNLHNTEVTESKIEREMKLNPRIHSSASNEPKSSSYRYQKFKKE